MADALRIDVPAAEMLPRGNEPRSSPSTPGSTGSSPSSPDSPKTPKPSGTSTAEPAPTGPVPPPAVSSAAPSTTAAVGGGPQTTLTPVPPERLTQTGAAPTAAPSDAPVVATSVDPAPVAPTSAASLTSAVVPGVILPTSFSTSKTAARQVSSGSTASEPPSRPTGGNALSEAQTSGGPQPMSKVGIGFGVVGAIGFLVGIGFLAWYFRKRFRRAKDRGQSRDFASAPPPAPASNRSDSRMINEMIMASYQTGNQSVNSYDYVGGGGYMDEKRQAAYAENEMAVPQRPAPAVQHGQKHSVSSWLGNHTPEMLNPLTARASMTSSAAGLKTPGLPRENEDSMPPMPQMDPRFQQEQQPQTFVPVPRQPMPAEYYYPINPNPERAPPPPARMSMARTETTARTSGTWNTWGVEQHRPNANGSGNWKGRLGL